jgi:NADH pyrophosphatase NudC (nudix superfamily)
MTAEGVQIYLHWVNFSLLRDAMNDKCHDMFEMYLRDRAHAIYLRTQLRKEPFSVIVEQELNRGAIDDAAATIIMCTVTKMLTDETFCQEVCNDAELWSSEDYDGLYSELQKMDQTHVKLARNLMRLFMLRGVWKAFLKCQMELMEAFLSSQDGLVALGLDEEYSEQLSKALMTVRCYHNSTICRHCFKRTKQKTKQRCRACKAMWFCNTRCSVASHLDKDNGHFHDCLLISSLNKTQV